MLNEVERTSHSGDSNSLSVGDQLESSGSQQADPEQSNALSDLREKILGVLQEVQQTPAYADIFEFDLERLGLLSEMEELGIVPVAENPNPFSVESDEDRHEQWWKQHPVEAEEFHRRSENREEILKHLYFGAILGRLAGEKLDRSIDKRNESLRSLRSILELL